jgi:hypothetical protein
MVDGHLFDKLAAIADQLRRKTDRPFGGIQVGLPHLLYYINHSSNSFLVVFSLLSLVISFNFRQ